eukprot:PhF_6_TR42630/c1_g1_i1/m.64104/K13507/GAT; glycerol-3-phosphate O-acyltransferase / dihydroxyacetone phosphate acyltransferase
MSGTEESPSKRRASTASRMIPTILCTECNREFPINEYLNHRDGLRNVAYGHRTLNLIQRFLLVPLMDAVIWVLVNVFYREVIVVGNENIPEKGPVVFYGNHQNQFIDALILRSCCKRDVRFIIAAKSMTRPVVGQFARLMNSVPVTRPQDVAAVNGDGVVQLINGVTLTGDKTLFKKFNPGDIIIFPTLETPVAAGEKKKKKKKDEEEDDKDIENRVQIHAVLSDTVITLTKPFSQEVNPTLFPTGLPYKVSRRIDNSEMYAEVYGTLERNNAIGIFPEGGSHDRPSLLPLKAGVALFSLGSAERGLNPTIIPFGLTYFYGHRFRSVAHIEFGKPIVAPPELVKKFSADKRAATQEFLSQLDQALRAITINAPDYDTVKFIHEFRRLFQPHNVVLPAQHYLLLFRRIAKVVENHKDHAGVKQFRSNVAHYMDKCSSLFIRDAQVATLKDIEKKPTRRLLLRRVVMLIVIGMILTPFGMIGLPLGFVARAMAESHALQAKAASDVKLFGQDVKATYKLIIGFVLFPIVCFLISMVAYWIDGFHTATTVFVCIPLVMYVSLHIGRDWIMELRAAFPLFLSILSNHKQFAHLYLMRQQLVQQAWALILELDASLPEEVIGYASDRPTREASLFSLRHVSRDGDSVDRIAKPLKPGEPIPKVASMTDLAALAASVGVAATTPDEKKKI